MRLKDEYFSLDFLLKIIISLPFRFRFWLVFGFFFFLIFNNNFSDDWRFNWHPKQYFRWFQYLRPFRIAFVFFFVFFFSSVQNEQNINVYYVLCVIKEISQFSLLKSLIFDCVANNFVQCIFQLSFVVYPIFFYVCIFKETKKKRGIKTTKLATNSEAHMYLYCISFKRIIMRGALEKLNNLIWFRFYLFGSYAINVCDFVQFYLCVA